MSEFSGDDLWDDFEQNEKLRQKDSFEAAGLNEEILARLLGRGYLIKEVIRDSAVEGDRIYFHYCRLPDSPAMRMWLDPELTDEERVIRGEAFFRDAIRDPDDDHFRAQWPEYYPKDII